MEAGVSRSIRHVCYSGLAFAIVSALVRGREKTKMGRTRAESSGYIQQQQQQPTTLTRPFSSPPAHPTKTILWCFLPSRVPIFACRHFSFAAAVPCCAVLCRAVLCLDEHKRHLSGFCTRFIEKYILFCPPSLVRSHVEPVMSVLAANIMPRLSVSSRECS